MFPPHQHHPKRRKKRPIHSVKTVDVTRGKSGYGFTISGQHPCVLSCILNNSPADRVGLRPGDYLMSVNGQDVSKFGHDEVVRMVGMSTGTLTIQVAENYNSSDSSDDEYHPRTKSKYPSRVKRSQRYGEKMEKLLSDINQRDRYCPDGHSHDPNSRPLPRTDIPKARTSRPRLHTPVGAENNEILSEGRSVIEAGGGVFKVPFQKSVSASNVPAASRLPLQRVEPKQAFIKSTSHGQFRNVPHNTHPSRMVDNHMYSNFSPTSLQQIINHSLNSYSAANEAFILNEDDFDDADEDEQLNPNGGAIRIIVGYIGSLEMPADANQPHVRIQSFRNAVRRLRVEQKIHTLVLMTVSIVGVKLTNMNGVDIALYPVKRLAFCGVCPDDRRFFGIVTLNKTNGDGDDSSEEDSPRSSGSSSCHVFMVDPEMSVHNIHAQKARSFGLTCTVDQQTQRCSEFPRSTTPVILSISNLYKDRPEGTVSNDVARSQVFASPNQPVQERRSSTSSNNSNSDSGLGLGREDNSTERIAAADIPPPPLPQRQPQLPQIKWSGNTIHLTQGPVKQFTPQPSPQQHSKHSPHQRSGNSSLKSPQNFNAQGLDMTVNADDITKMGDKFNIRAMPNPASAQTGSRGHLPMDNLEEQTDADYMRLSMQKLLQARQKQSGLDQTSSDTESRSSRSDGILSTNLAERPVSAPFKYLSGDSSSDLKTNTLDSTRSKTANPYSSDSNVADKLSPRAFLSSAFTPLGSLGSAFTKTRSRPKLHQLRSPSAPPIPSYHGDDEASDEDDMNGLIERFEQDRSFGLSDMDPRRYSEGYALNKKRDQERKGVTPTTTPEIKTTSSTEKWMKPKQESLRRKTIRKNPLSLSHESLVVFDQEPMQQKLSSANSVNSIVGHVAKTMEQEEVGRVAGWAVRFEKLLQDSVGIKVFTDFLKKEFSEENVEFWKVCEDYRNIIDSNFRKSKAKEIFDQYVSLRGSHSVNIDSNARKQAEIQLDNPTPQTFEVAQSQIFQLMKQDSFSRFLKSDLYKDYLMKEMEGKPLETGVTMETSAEKAKNDKHGEKENKKKGKGKENEEYKEKRRRSLLPWRQNFIGNKKSNAKSSSEGEAKTSKSKLKDEKEKEVDVNSNVPLPAPVQSTEVPIITNRNPSIPRVELPETIDEEPEQPRFCRVIMPDGSTTVVGAKQGQTINYVLGKMLDKRGLSIASVDVFLLGSDKPLNLNDDISSLGSKEVTVERRVLFRMDLPNKKSIGVKAKPNRMIRDVFKPILNKYGYRMDAIDVHLCGHTEPLHLEEPVSAIDNQRVVVTTLSVDTPGGDRRRSTLFGFIRAPEKRSSGRGKGSWETENQREGHLCPPEKYS